MRFRLWTILWVFAVLAFAMATFGCDRVGASQSISHPIRNDLRQLQISLAAIELLREKSRLSREFISEDDAIQAEVSWRVLVIPYLEEMNLYKQYNFEEPWNSPHNSKLLEEMPPSFSYPDPFGSISKYLPGDCKPDETTYLTITGEGTLWSSDNRLQLPKRRDHSKKTILLIHVPASGIKWTEPRDLTLDEAVELLSSTTIPGLISYTDKLFTVERWEHPIRYVVFSSGEIYTINCGLKPGVARALCMSEGIDDAMLGEGDSLLPMERTSRLTATIIKWDRVVIAIFLSLLFVYTVYAIIWNMRRKYGVNSQIAREDGK